MAQLGFAVAGAAVGAMFGMPQLGWIAGAAIGGLLFPSKGPSTEGPRLGDLSVSSSAYGMPIPIIYGTMRVAGNMIWSSGLREVRKKQKVGGKGGGGGTQTTYTYYASFAVAFGEGPADDVVRIWADSKLIHDCTQWTRSGKTSTAAHTSKAGVKFRFHPGNETQLPDPLIEANVGAGRAPAHRGLCVIVFEDLPLADFGNRVPNINAEISYNRVAQKPVLAADWIQPAEGGLLQTATRDTLAVDWIRNVGYTIDQIGDTADQVGLRRFSLVTLKEDRQARMSDIVPPEGRVNSVGQPLDLTDLRTVVCVDPDGYIYMQFGSQYGSRIIRIEPNSLREVARFGTRNDYSLVGFTKADFGYLSRMVIISAYGLNGREDFLYCMSTWGVLGLLKAKDLNYVWGDGNGRFGVDDGMARGAVGEGYGEGWALLTYDWNVYGSALLYRMRVEWNAGIDLMTGQTLGVEHRLMARIYPAELQAGATTLRNRCGGLAYDPSDNSVIFMMHVKDPEQAYVLKWREDLGIVWKTPLPFMINWNANVFDQTRIERGRWTLTRDHRVWQVDTATGAVVYNELWPSDIDDWGDQVYDGVTDTLYLWAASGLRKAFLGRGGGAGVTVSSIVADLSARAGLAEADINVAGLTDIVPGYVISRQTTVRGAIEPLAQAYFFGGVEIDDQLVYRKRGGGSVASIPGAALVPFSEEETWRERRAQEVDLPERVSVVSLNPQMNYQQAVQSEKRIALPTPAMHSRNQTAVELPIAMDATTAKRIAARMLYLAWLERAAYECSLPPPWLRIDPTDVVTLEFAGGGSFRSRTVRVDVGADFTLSMRGVSDAVAAYTSGVQADAGSGLPAQLISAAGPTYLLVPDIPLLRDVDDTGGAASRVYLAGGGYGEPNWRSAVVYYSAEGTTWESVAGLMEESAYGTTVSALAAPASAFCTDETSVLKVAMVTGADRLESVTQEVMLAGANAALLLKANGEPEIIQFRDVTLEGQNVYSLRGLLRGRRGTDVFMGGHAIGETFLLLEADTMQIATVPLGDLGVSRQWRAVSVGSLFEDAPVHTRIHTGRDLKPYAPWDVRAALSGGDIVLTWQRRTRIGGEWKDGTGQVPLAEASLAFEVDILSGPGGAVKRTLAVTAAQATYVAAAIATDFGTTPASLSVVVYQLSAVVGRGFPRDVTLEIA